MTRDKQNIAFQARFFSFHNANKSLNSVVVEFHFKNNKISAHFLKSVKQRAIVATLNKNNYY